MRLLLYYHTDIFTVSGILVHYHMTFKQCKINGIFVFWLKLNGLCVCLFVCGGREKGILVCGDLLIYFIKTWLIFGAF